MNCRGQRMLQKKTVSLILWEDVKKRRRNMTMWRISIPAGSEGSVCSRTLSSALTGSRGWPPPPCWLLPSGGQMVWEYARVKYLQGQSKSIGRRYSVQGGKRILGFHWEGHSDGFHNPFKTQTTSFSARQVGLKSEMGRLKIIQAGVLCCSAWKAN